jgi:hypothetical protein
MGLISRIGVAGAGLAASGTIVLFATIGGAGAHADAGPAPLRESASCGHPLPADAGSGPVRGVAQQINVAVPATALIRIDHAGRIAAALTNTGCAPRTGDDIYIVRADGSVDPTPIHELPSPQWFGDFTVAGVYVSQR